MRAAQQRVDAEKVRIIVHFLLVFHHTPHPIGNITLRSLEYVGRIRNYVEAEGNERKENQ